MYTSSVQQIPGGRPGLKAKVRQIRYLVEGAKRDPHFRQSVARMLGDLEEKDHDGEIGRLVDFTKDGIRYMRDPWSPTGIELFVDPRTMLGDIEKARTHEQRPAGDCDDHVLLASSLLETAGYPTRYMVGGMPPDHYKHIWIEVHHPRDGWLPVELTKKDAPVGWDPSPRFPLVEIYKGGGGASMRGLGCNNVGPVVPMHRPGFRQRQSSLPFSWRPANALGGFDFDSMVTPRSFHNTYRQEGIYAGATPSDFFRATEIRAMAPAWSGMRHSTLLGLDHSLYDWDDLEGFGSFFKKIGRTISKPFEKLGKKVQSEVLQPIEKFGKANLPIIAGVGATLLGGPGAGLIALQTTAGIQAGREAKKEQERIEAQQRAELEAVRQEQIKQQEAAQKAYELEKARSEAEHAKRLEAIRSSAAQVSSLPSSLYSTIPGPSFYQSAGGFALPPGTPDQVAVMDQQPDPTVPLVGWTQSKGVPVGVLVALAAGVPLLFMMMRRRR